LSRSNTDKRRNYCSVQGQSKASSRYRPRKEAIAIAQQIKSAGLASYVEVCAKMLTDYDLVVVGAGVSETFRLCRHQAYSCT